MGLKSDLFGLTQNWVENLGGEKGQIVWLLIKDYFLNLFIKFGGIKLFVASELESGFIDPESEPETEIYFLVWLASQGVADGQRSLAELMGRRDGVYCPFLLKESNERLIKKLLVNE